jgi:mRNA-degrading endonuclease toxin of MazEF toxin-antitoxin module
MVALKHVGRVINTGRRCVVVFREMYNEKGHVTDENSCLVFETETLPDAEHQDLMRIVESGSSQSTGDLFDVLARERLGSGVTALSWLSESNRLHKVATNNVELTPDSTTVLGLVTLNKIVKMQKAGSSQKDIENMLRDDTDQAPRVAETVTDVLDSASNVDAQTGEGVLDDATIAESYLRQAAAFDAQAKELRESAEKLVPTVKPTRVRKVAPKKSANK